ncbi:Ima1 N-terminal domain-containing protein [Sparassis latifolia]|uniref:Ima1 N-terminal domain-containing protein n=1 Tax=Sparassis crispa TaxID=139825 RepID=A0A401G797_9APHY|nr:hypothetical protein SCP_0109160 [Sparassis crispa]GBE78034.1 hypothetical protein SCP_0109160 [Sparassis crispa]
MSKIFRQHSSVACFYCQTAITPFPHNPRSFRCPNCDCWNRYGNDGEIISEEPAMHDEKMNTRSFARRGSPRKDRLPSIYGSVLFCHTCQTNQMLLAQLLSNYLPPQDDPEYAERSETYDEYRRSVEVRYPPVCAECAPAVEEEIRRRDQMARTQALGGFLHATKRTTLQAPESQKDKDRLQREIAAWKIRGCLWLGSLACALGGYVAVVSRQGVLRLPGSFRLVIPVITPCSILWTVWDPTYASLRREQFQGRAVRQRGKRVYVVLQMMAWLSRLCTSVFIALSLYRPEWDRVQLWDDPQSTEARMYCSISIVLELFVLVTSHFTLQLQHPPKIRLMDGSEDRYQFMSPTSSQPSTRSTTPAVAIEPDLLNGLSLSSNGVMRTTTPKPKPIFGVASFPAGPSQSPSRSHPAGPSSTTPSSPLRHAPPNDSDMEIADDEFPSASDDPDAMDWSPIRPTQHPPRSDKKPVRLTIPDDGVWLRPQRFFAPEEPTGLENLFAKTIKLADDEQQCRGGASGVRRQAGRRCWPAWWALIGMLPLLPLAGFVWYSRWKGVS